MDLHKKTKNENQIQSEQRAISYDMKEFTIELYVKNILTILLKTIMNYTYPNTKENLFGMRNINLAL